MIKIEYNIKFEVSIMLIVMMKKVFSAVVVLLLTTSTFYAEKGTTIKIKVKGLKNKTCYLAGYFGNKQYYKDTATTDANGICVFERTPAFEGGVYSFVESNRLLFEIVVNEASINMETDTIDYVGNMVINKSEENKIFYEHLAFVNQQQKKIQPLREELKDEKLKEKRKKEIQEELQTIDNATKKYRVDVMEKHPSTFVAKMFLTMKETDVPEFDDEKDDEKRRTLKYEHLKANFFKDVDFSDDRLIRTPIYHNKIEKYFKSVVYPHPDSIIHEADRVIKLAEVNDDIYKYTVHYITTHYERSKIMGMDAIFSHMGLKYYTHEKAFWLDSNQVEKIREKATKLQPLLMGKKAINLSLLDTSGTKWRSIDEIQSDYTILIFWDPDCGHCKKELPKIAEYYKTIKDKSVSVFAVSSDHNSAWKKFIRENELDFINVAVPKEVYEDQSVASEYIIKGYTDLKSLNYHSTYDVYSTPQFYLLDKNKTIIGKKFDVELLEKILTNEFEKKG